MLRKERNRALAALLCVMIALSLFTGIIPAAAAAQEQPYTKAENGLWITEIFHNDVNDRNLTYPGSSGDVFEFVEIVNTSDETIVFNDTYTFWYEYISNGQMITQANPLTVTSLEEAVPTIGPGETVIIRLGRNNADWFPSNDDFRLAMDAKPGVKIWLAEGQNGWAENGRGCSIRLKSDKNTILSRYIYNFTVLPDGTYETLTDAVSADGLSVSLQIPDFGYEMLTWEKHSIPTPGYVYNEQYNGQKVIIPDITAPAGLYITEVLPQDSTTVTRARFGSEGNQILEFIELTNTTDRDINFNEEYQLTYGTKVNNGTRLRSGGNERIVIVTQPDDPYNDECIIPAGKSVVVWIHREETNTQFMQDKYGFTMGMLTQRQNAAAGVTTVYDTFPTLADFREIRGIPDDVIVFTCRNINGMGNDRNTVSLRKIIDPDTDTPNLVTAYKTELVSQYMYYTSEKGDTSGGRSAMLRVSPEGPKMSLYQAAAVPTPGSVNTDQLTYLQDDGKTPVFMEWADSPVPASIEQGSIFRTPYYYENTKSVELFYRLAGTDSFIKTVSTSFSIYNKWYTFIPADVLLHAEYFDFYIKAKGVYRSVQTDIKRIYIDKIDDATGLRVSLDGVTATGEEAVSGTINVTAKDFSNATVPITMTLDGINLPVSPALEKGAFFTFTHDGGNGLDAYFKNALVVKEHEDDDFGEIIKLFPQNSEIPGLSSQAIRVDSKYFKYNPDGSASIDLYIYAGTHGNTFESFTAENNDDFTAQWVRLSLPDGTTYRPTEYKGFRVTTGPDGTGTEKLGWFTLDPDTRISVGDSNNLHVYVKAAFTIPASPAKLDAFAAQIDTTALADGIHSLVVTSDGLSTAISLNVDNSVHVKPGPEPLPATALLFTTDTAQYPVKATVAAQNGDKNVAVYEAKTAGIGIYEGIGDSTAAAVEKTGDNAAVSAAGEFPYFIYELAIDANETDSVRFDLTTSADYGRDVQLYALNVADYTWELLRTTRFGDDITAIFPLVDKTENGKAYVLAQARGTEYTPYTNAKAPLAEKNDYAQIWTGEGEHAIPQQYDFSIAWITDTQYYMEQYIWQINSMTDWILANRDVLNIEYVIHTGDIVDEWNEEYQFINASNVLQRFDDAGIPYGVLAGNHDVAHGAEKYDLYWEYFGEDRYYDNIWYGDSYKNNLGHYDLVTVDGVELIFVYMSWDMYYPELDWINGVLAEYSDRIAIVAIHPGLNASAEQSYHANLIMREVASKNENVIAVINGHYHGSALNFMGFDDDGDGVNDRVVYQICTDYQSAPEGGAGYIKMLYFDLANGKIYLNSYSPTLDDFNYYDTPKLAEYKMGLNIYNIDITELDVEFNRDTVKTLTASDVSAAVLTNTELGAAQANGDTDVYLDCGPGETFIYAVATDQNGKITAYSKAVAITLEDVATPFAAEALTLTPGANASAMNFTWYSDKNSGTGTSALKIAKKSNMDGKTFPDDAMVVEGTFGDATDGKYWHKVSAVGLQQDTIYVYSVSNDKNIYSEIYEFKTGAAGAFTFAVVGDPQLTTGSQDSTSNYRPGGDVGTTKQGWQDTMSVLGSIGVDFVAGVGDQVDTSLTTNEDEYANFFAPAEMSSIPFAPAVGNHDRHDGFAYHYNLPNEQSFAPLTGADYGSPTASQAEAEARGNYYYTYNNALFVVLNTSSYPASKEAAQAVVARFDATLQAAVTENPGYDWLFVQHHKSTESVADHLADRDIQYYVEAGFEKLMDKYAVDFVLAGHDHVYARSYPMFNGTPDKTGTSGEANVTLTSGGDGADYAVNPNGTVYFTATTGSGLKYYELFNNAGNLYVKDNIDYPYLVNNLFGSLAYMDWNLPLSTAKYLQNKTPGFLTVTVNGNEVTFAYHDLSDEYLYTPYDTYTVVKEYVAVTYTVVFDADNGSEIVTAIVGAGENVPKPQDPVKEGYSFLGWFADGEAFDFDAVVMSDITLTAKWEEVPVSTYTVSFVDYDGALLKAETVEEGKAATAPANPVREGYTFTGWDAAFTNVTSDMTITAQYTLNETVTIISVTPSAYVTKLNGSKNDLTITITVVYSDGTTNTITETFSINNNAADTYTVAGYKVYVNTKGNDQIRECFIVT